MKVKVLKRFRDKHSNEIHKVGDILDITKKRYNEILKVDKLIEKVEDDQEEKEEELEEKVEEELEANE